MHFSAAIFDLDGTLIESNSVWEKIDRIILEKRGIKFDNAYINSLTSMSFEEALVAMHEAGVTDSDEVIMKEFFALAENEYRHNIFLKENVREYLFYLKKNNIKIALATASPAFLYESVLRNNNIYGMFDAFVTTDEVGKSKDYPDIYLVAAAKLNTVPKDCVVFEDILKGIVSAKNAGMKTVAVYDFYSQDDAVTLRLTADKFISNFAEMY